MSDARDEIIDLFEKGIFPYKNNAFKTKEEESEKESEKDSKEESEESKIEKIKDDYKKIIKYIENESEGINYELFKKHFNFVVPSVSVKQLYETKNKNKNNELVNVIKSGLSDLKDEIENMSENEIKTEKSSKILKIVEEIIIFNRENKKQQGLGSKPNA